MALGGGTFLVQNKRLPGAYINTVSVAAASATLSDRGYAALPLEMNWGPQGEIFTVEQGDFLKNSQKLFGYSYTAAALQPMREVFCHAKTVHFFRLDSGGIKASCAFGSAKYPGIRGNALRVVITASESSTEQTPLYDVETFLDTQKVETQEGISTAAELADNDFIVWNRVHFSVDGTDVFYGYVFAKKSVSDGLISVTAYDQLRYLKNKDTFIGTGLKASELLKRLSEDFRLQTGTIEDTGHVIDIIDEQNQTLFDMIQNALDETLTNTGKLYVLYDDVGRLCLRNINRLKLDLVVDAETGESYTYQTSIDSQTYDKVKLFYENDKTGKRELYVAQDSSNISKWGVLQYCEQIKTTTGVQAKANALLKLYNNRTRSLGLKGVFGDPRVRAGCSIIVSLTLPDMTLCNYMVVHKVTHSFQGERHSMDLTLIGGEFISG